MTKLNNGTWVLIADGEKALFLQNKTDGDDPFLDVFREEEQENPANRDQAANRPGRFNDGPGVQRSAVDDTDWHELQKERFAHDLADILYKHAHKGAYDSIVLVAPPRTLGE
ncbi:MAG: host attachment protein, partial [Sulfitobacter sp.]|nr:host attachment protein [Sulfitobacter sp.]